MTARSASAGLALGGALWVTATLVGDGAGEGSDRFYASETVWLLAQSALLLGTVGLWRSRPHGSAGTGVIGFAMAVTGRAVFVAAEVAALASGEPQDLLLPAAALLTAIGMVVAGAAILRAHRWSRWRRFVPLAVGAYPFVAMFPIAGSSGDGPPMAALALWGAWCIALGAAAQAESAARTWACGPVGLEAAS